MILKRNTPLMVEMIMSGPTKAFCRVKKHLCNIFCFLSLNKELNALGMTEQHFNHAPRPINSVMRNFPPIGATEA